MFEKYLPIQVPLSRIWWWEQDESKFARIGSESSIFVVKSDPSYFVTSSYSIGTEISDWDPVCKFLLFDL